MIAEDDKVAVTRVNCLSDGKRFWNTKIMTCQDHQVIEVKVDLGWSVLHAVAPGIHSDPS